MCRWCISADGKMDSDHRLKTTFEVDRHLILRWTIPLTYHRGLCWHRPHSGRCWRGGQSGIQGSGQRPLGPCPGCGHHIPSCTLSDVSGKEKARHHPSVITTHARTHTHFSMLHHYSKGRCVTHLTLHFLSLLGHSVRLCVHKLHLGLAFVSLILFLVFHLLGKHIH